LSPSFSEGKVLCQFPNKLMGSAPGSKHHSIQESFLCSRTTENSSKDEGAEARRSEWDTEGSFGPNPWWFWKCVWGQSECWKG
jgi:hypothetical protein